MSDRLARVQSVLSRVSESVSISQVIQGTETDFDSPNFLTEKETFVPLNCEATFQPLTPQAVLKLPEEFRTRKLWSVNVISEEIYLRPKDIVVDPSGVRYRVVNARDWRKEGFTKYLVEEDYDK